VEVTGHTSSSPTGTEYHFSSQDQLKPGGGMSLSQTTRKQELERERERERERESKNHVFWRIALKMKHACPLQPHMIIITMHASSFGSSSLDDDKQGT
jgi:hypothetical protein